MRAGLEAGSQAGGYAQGIQANCRRARRRLGGFSKAVERFMASEGCEYRAGPDAMQCDAIGGGRQGSHTRSRASWI